MSAALVALAVVAAPEPPPPPAPRDAYAEAVAARHAGETTRAIALLEQLLAQQPGHVDARLQLGLSYLAANRLDDADAAFRAVLAETPQYDDARIGLAWVAMRRGDHAAARAEVDRVGDQKRAEVGSIRRQLAAGVGARWRIDVDGSYSFVEKRADWKEGAVRLRYQADPRTAVSGGIEAARRFGRNDVFGEVQIDHRFSDRFSGYLAFGATPNAQFLPDWRIAAGGSARLTDSANPTVLTLDARQAHYAIGDVQMVNPGIEQYLANGRAWVTARMINVFDERGDHHAGYSLRGDVLASDRVRLFAGFADAQDVSEGVVIDTFSVSGGVTVQINDRYALRASLAHEDRASGADRLQAALGFSLSF